MYKLSHSLPTFNLQMEKTFLRLLPPYPFILVLFWTVTALFSCNETDEPIPGNGIPKIQTEAVYVNGVLKGTVTYEYDTEGRLIKKTNSNKKYDTYSFEPGKLIFSGYDGTGNSPYIDTLLLNEKGLLINQGSGTNVYEYDEAGYLVKFQLVDDMPIMYTISGGNTVKAEQRDIQSSFSNIETKKFLSNLNTIGNENKGITWYGKQDKNLMYESYTQIKSPWQNITRTFSYGYEFDSKNRVIKRKTLGEKSEIYVSYTYY